MEEPATIREHFDPEFLVSCSCSFFSVTKQSRVNQSRVPGENPIADCDTLENELWNPQQHFYLFIFAIVLCFIESFIH